MGLSSPKRRIHTDGRVPIIVVLTIVVFLLLAGRSAFLQVVRGPELQEQANAQHLGDEKVLIARRGSILDRDGVILAQSLEAYRVDVRPQAIPEDKRDEVMATLSEALMLPFEDIKEKFAQFNTPFPLVRQIDLEVGEKLISENLPGIDVLPAEKRVYPLGSLAAHILGFVHPDFSSLGREELFGLEGIEAVYEDVLHGQGGKAVFWISPQGEKLPLQPEEYIPAKDGCNVILTIDSMIQNTAEIALEKTIKEKNAKSGCVIVLDSRTGEILALASWPGFDPGNWASISQKNLFNVATNFIYEPGSVFKFVVGAAALEEGSVEPNTVIEDAGPYTVADASFSCPAEFGGPHGKQTLSELFQNSCNVGFIQIGQKLGMQKLYEYSRLFGFGRPTSLELPQAAGELSDWEEWYETTLATMSFGYGLQVTPLQLASAFQIVANDGRFVPLHLLKEIRDSESRVIQETQPQVTRQVISQKTAIQLREVLKGVVEKNIPDGLKQYGVVGKTGTAVAWEDGNYLRSNNTTFVGAIPADDPQVVVLVNINQPQVDFAYAVRVCVPAFMEIASKIVDLIRLPPP